MSGDNPSEGTARELRIAARDLRGRALLAMSEGRPDEAKILRKTARVLESRARRRQAAEAREERAA